MTDWLHPLEDGRRPATRRRTRKSGPASFEEAVERFAERHVSKRTGRPFSVTSRRNVLDNLLGSPLTAYRARHGIQTVQQWSGDHAAAYLRWLHEELRRDPATIMKVRGQLRSFGSYCDSHYRTAGAGTGALATFDVLVADPSAPRRSERALTREEADAVIRAAPTPRDRLAVTMLVYTGMRPSELLSLEPRDIDLTAAPGVVRVRGSVHAESTRAARTVPLTIGQTALPLLLKLHMQDVRGAAARTLFVSKRAGAHGEPTPLTLNGLRAMLFDLGRDTGIPCQAGRLRHTFCTWCAAAGVPILELQELLGLASTDMVAAYYRDRRAGAASGIAARVRFGPPG